MFPYSYDVFYFFFFMQKTAYDMRIIDWSSDVFSSDLANVSPLSTNDTAFQFFVGQRQRRARAFEGVLAGVPLDRQADDAARLFLGAGLCFFQNAPGQLARVLQRFQLDFRSEARRVGKECVQ